MLRFRDRPIRQKLVIITMATAAAALLLAGWGIVTADSFLFRGYLRRDLSALLRWRSTIRTRRRRPWDRYARGCTSTARAFTGRTRRCSRDIPPRACSNVRRRRAVKRSGRRWGT